MALHFWLNVDYIPEVFFRESIFNYRELVGTTTLQKICVNLINLSEIK